MLRLLFGAKHGCFRTRCPIPLLRSPASPVQAHRIAPWHWNPPPDSVHADDGPYKYSIPGSGRDKAKSGVPQRFRSD